MLLEAQPAALAGVDREGVAIRALVPDDGEVPAVHAAVRVAPDTQEQRGLPLHLHPADQLGSDGLLLVVALPRGERSRPDEPEVA
ncbi:MAG: hypothetical protein M3P39_05565 [Actinomycetota bacterium]|nr:hypothetical protein [Actinomycetota bacterium]